MTYSAEVLADSPAGYWRFEDSNPPFQDETAGNHDGTILGPSRGAISLLEPGVAHSRGIRFSTDQNTGNAEVRFPAGVWASPTSYTMEMWIYQTDRVPFSSDTKVLIGYGGGEQGRVSLFTFPAGATWIRLFSTNGAVSATRDSSILKLNRWYHVVGVFTTPATSIAQDVYINGALDNQASTNQGTASHPVPTSGQTTDINYRNNADTFPGYMDEVAVYPTALSAARISAHYDAAIADNIFAGNNHLDSRNPRPHSLITSRL